MRKIAISMGMATYTSLEYYLNLRIDDFIEVNMEIEEVSKSGQE